MKPDVRELTGVLTGHSTQMPQNGSRVIGEDSEVPSMSEEMRDEGL